MVVAAGEHKTQQVCEAPRLASTRRFYASTALGPFSTHDPLRGSKPRVGQLDLRQHMQNVRK